MAVAPASMSFWAGLPESAVLASARRTLLTSLALPAVAAAPPFALGPHRGKGHPSHLSRQEPL